MSDAAHSDHPAHLAHHFETSEQQLASAKTGMWVFLATEILMFGGLFCAYAVYRRNNPEIFDIGHRYLDANMGAINTVVLLLSSFTMAWAVRAAQMNQRKLLITMLVLTLMGAFGFMGIKYVEYSHKIHLGIAPGSFYDPHVDEHDEAVKEEATPEAVTQAPSSKPQVPATTPLLPADQQSNIAPAHAAPLGMVAAETEPHDAHGKYGGGDHGHYATQAELDMAFTFFSIYYLMTGLHGLHVLIGIGVIFWLIRRAVRGDFSSEYFTPVDLGGLYWHLVDLVWIFLFPLLYLIH